MHRRREFVDVLSQALTDQLSLAEVNRGAVPLARIPVDHPVHGNTVRTHVKSSSCDVMVTGRHKEEQRHRPDFDEKSLDRFRSGIVDPGFAFSLIEFWSE